MSVTRGVLRLGFGSHRDFLADGSKSNPEHPEYGDLAVELEKLGATVHRLSTEGRPAEKEDVLLIDKMGVLARFFGAADIAIVGGAWNPIGGHNLLEPAAQLGMIAPEQRISFILFQIDLYYLIHFVLFRLSLLPLFLQSQVHSCRPLVKSIIFKVLPRNPPNNDHLVRCVQKDL